MDAAAGRHVTINATGAITALLLEIRIPVPVTRAMAVVSRAGGLAGHVREEQATGSARCIWNLARDGIAYENPWKVERVGCGTCPKHLPWHLA